MAPGRDDRVVQGLVLAGAAVAVAGALLVGRPRAAVLMLGVGLLVWRKEAAALIRDVASPLPILPLAGPVLVCLYAAGIRVNLGRWPEINNPDPGSSLVSLVVGPMCLVSLVSLLLGAPAGMLYAVGWLFDGEVDDQTRRRFRARALAWLAACGAAVWLVATDPGGVFSWYAD